jgi:hypothetical protein
VIDWVSFSLPYSGPPVGLQYFKRESWDAPIEPAFSKPVDVVGSHSSALKVQAIGGRLYVSGNPVKFFTGQNIAGTNDLGRLVRMTVDAVWDLLRLMPCLDAFRALESGDVNLTRVDCTFAYSVGSDDDVVTWLEAMERACHVRFRGRGHFDQGMCSLMFGLTMQGEGKKAKASRRSTFKFYNKWREVGAHPMTCREDIAQELRECILGAVRGEACYRGIELQRLGYERLSAWDEGTALKLHREWVDRMEMAETFTLKSEQEKDLPRWLQSTYRHWRSGEDVRGLLSRRTFYRQRKELLAHGIDIAQPRITAADPVKVIPILRVLEAKPIPEDDLEALFWRLVA